MRAWRQCRQATFTFADNTLSLLFSVNEFCLNFNLCLFPNVFATSLIVYLADSKNSPGLLLGPDDRLCCHIHFGLHTGQLAAFEFSSEHFTSTSHCR